uniref:Uncharacterized protein n=1 Tax=Arundo donax TaxID=35708 RepID=A0A0A9AEQ2_ARUDO
MVLVVIFVRKLVPKLAN